MIKAVVLDMDGTMFNTEEAWIAQCMEIQAQLGMAPDRDLQLQVLGGNNAYGEKIMRGRLGDAAYERYRPLIQEAAVRVHLRDVELKPGLLELLDFLAAQGIKIGVATSTPQAVARPALELTGVDRYMKTVVYGDMISSERGKPCPDIYLRALGELGAAPGEALGVEDSYNGVRALRRAGMVTVMIPDLLPATDEMRGLYDAELPTLLEVIPYIKQLNAGE